VAALWSFGVSAAYGAEGEEKAPDSVELAFDPSSGYRHFYATAGLGRGIRLNNPYRLATPLGDTAESLSLSATYLDLGAGAAFGPPDGLQHGARLELAMALDGIRQEVLTPSYAPLYYLPPRFWLLGRAGLPIVLEPDLNLGFELGVGIAALYTAGMGIALEAVASFVYGAATHERSATLNTVIALELGVWVDYEVLP
jgi:hypothetical protein